MSSRMSRRWLKVLMGAFIITAFLSTMRIIPPLIIGKSILIGGEQYPKPLPGTASSDQTKSPHDVDPIEPNAKDPSGFDQVKGDWDINHKATAIPDGTDTKTIETLGPMQEQPIVVNAETPPSDIAAEGNPPNKQQSGEVDIKAGNGIAEKAGWNRKTVSLWRQWNKILWDFSAPHPEIPPPFSAAKCAIILENEPSGRLNALLLHFHAVLGNTWPIFVFLANPASLTLAPSMTTLADGTRYDPTSTNTIHPFNLRALPHGFHINSHAAFSRMLVEPWLWSQLAPFEKVLLFQSDSILCANSQQRVDDFLEWDFIGAPIAPNLGSGFNGGLSIRNRTLMLDIIAANKDTPARKKTKFEDRFYYKELTKMPGVKLPNPLLANKFSTESIYGQKPLAYHQPKKWFKDKIAEKRKWCPEIDLVEGPRLRIGVTGIINSED